MFKKLLIATGVLIFLLLVTSWLLFGVFIYPGGNPHTGQSALVNGQFLTMADDEAEIIDDSALLIENGTIKAFVKEGKLPDDVNRINLENGYAMPGLFDMHVHLGGVPAAEGYSVPAMIFEFMRNFPNTREKFLRYGITTITSLGDMHPQGIDIRNATASGRLAGPRLRVAGPMLTSPGGHPVSTIFKDNGRAIQSATRQLDDPDEARTVVNQLVDDGVDLIKVIYTAGRNDTLPRMKYDVMEAIIDQAHQLQTKVVDHTDTHHDVEGAIRAGADGLEHMAFGLSDSLLNTIVEEDIVVVPTLAVMQKSTDEGRIKEIQQEFSRWLEYDIEIVLGTDAGNLPAGESVFTEIQAFVQAGMSHYEALQTATIKAARHAEVEKSLGSLEPGKYADIVVFKQNPLRETKNLQRPAMVFKEGKLKFDN